MKNKRLYIFLFVLLILAQWLVPMRMINEQEDIFNTGKVYKFKTAPVDPYDAFRGRYINLSFANNRFEMKDTKGYDYNTEVFVTFKDSAGYAIINSVSRNEPQKNSYYLKAKVSYIDNLLNNNFIIINYPFTQYYMNEFKAPKAEKAYTESARSLKNDVHAIVAIKNGKAIVKDVIIDNMPIKDYVEKIK